MMSCFAHMNFSCNVDAEKSLTCDFESRYVCGYEPLFDSRIQWERINVKDGDQHTSPSTDGSGNTKGNPCLIYNLVCWCYL